MPRANRGVQIKFYAPGKTQAPQWVAYWYVSGNRQERRSSIFDSRAVDAAEEFRRVVADELEHQPGQRGPLKPEQMKIAEALSIYAEERAPQVVDSKRIGYAMKALLPFFGHLMVSDMRPALCQLYVRERAKSERPVKASTARRELGVVHAAFVHCHSAGRLLSYPGVELPPKGKKRERWLTRLEAAWILRAIRRQPKALHLRTFVLCGLYAAHRTTAILQLQWLPNMAGGWIDLASGRIDFNPIERDADTNKRRSLIPIPGRLLVHLRQARRRTRQFAIETAQVRRDRGGQPIVGKPVKQIKHAFETACRLAEKMAKAKGVELDLSDVTPHVLRHTSCTWMMHARVDRREAAAYAGMTPETFDRIYAHHHPDYMKGAAGAWDRSRART